MWNKLINIHENYEFVCYLISKYIKEFGHDVSKVKLMQKAKEHKYCTINSWSIIAQPSHHVNFRGLCSNESCGEICEHAGQILDFEHFGSWVDAHKYEYNTTDFDCVLK